MPRSAFGGDTNEIPYTRGGSTDPRIEKMRGSNRCFQVCLYG